MYQEKIKKAIVISTATILVMLFFLIFSLWDRTKPAFHHYKTKLEFRIQDDNGADIRILTFNIWMPHIWLPGNEKSERLTCLADSLMKINADIVCLQEVFDLHVRKTLIDFFTDTYLVNEETLCKQRVGMFFSKDCFGGLVTLSKFPIIEEHFYEYNLPKGANLAERLGKKGFLITTVRTPAGEIHIINTHLYSGIKEKQQHYRLDQIKYIEKICLEQNLFKKPVFLIGDLNLLHPLVFSNNKPFVYHYITDSLRFIDVSDLTWPIQLTYDPKENRYANLWYNRDYGRQRFDYSLFRMPEGYGLKIFDQKVVFNTDFLLSDHFGYYFYGSLSKFTPD